jgi:hypothetical protein
VIYGPPSRGLFFFSPCLQLSFSGLEDKKLHNIRDANHWFVSYFQKLGCVRGFAVAESGPNKGRIYAAVEVGGVLVSMVERFVQADDELFAVLSNGGVWSRKLSGKKWDRVLPEIAEIKAVAATN